MVLSDVPVGFLVPARSFFKAFAHQVCYFLLLTLCMSAAFTQAGDLATSSELVDSELSSSLSPVQLNAHKVVANIVQVGQENLAVISQSAHNSTATIIQEGTNNLAEIQQFGSENYAEINQFGSNNSADILQSGLGNSITVTQYGDRQFSMQQVGENSSINITQY